MRIDVQSIGRIDIKVVILIGEVQALYAETNFIVEIVRHLHVDVDRSVRAVDIIAVAAGDLGQIA